MKMVIKYPVSIRLASVSQVNDHVSPTISCGMDPKSLTSPILGLHATLSPNAAALFVLDEEHMPALDVLQYLKVTDPDAMSNSECRPLLPSNCLQLPRLL